MEPNAEDSIDPLMHILMQIPDEDRRMLSQIVERWGDLSELGIHRFLKKPVDFFNLPADPVQVLCLGLQDTKSGNQWHSPKSLNCPRCLLRLPAL